MTIKRNSLVRVNSQSQIYQVAKINESEQTAYLVPPKYPVLDAVKRDRVWVSLNGLIEVLA